MIKTAVISECGKYRYMLGRRWNDGQPITWCMLNPSTADHEEDDATITRCINFSKHWGYGSIRVINIYAYRATDRKELWKVPDPVGPLNEFQYAADFWDCPIVCAWGADAKKEHIDKFMELAPREHLFCLGKNKGGSPKHPLYIKADKELEIYGE